MKIYNIDTYYDITNTPVENIAIIIMQYPGLEIIKDPKQLMLLNI